MSNPDSSQEHFVDRTLRTIVEGTAASTGEQFFYALVKQLASVLGVRYAFISEFIAHHDRVRTLAFWQGEGFCENVEYHLGGTPCEQVLRGEICHYPQGVQGFFPQDHSLKDLRAESYLALPLSTPHREVLGHLAVLDDKPMPLKPYDLPVFKIFSARAGAELDRKRAETALRESEEKFSLILECALDAIVTFDEKRNIVLFNSAAEKMFGCPLGNALRASIDQFLSPDLLSMVTEYMTGKATERLSPARWIPEGFSAVRQDGQPFPIEASLSKAVVTHGTLYTIILRDINERKRAEAALNKIQSTTGYLQEEINAVYNFEELIGASLAMKTVFKSVDTVALTDSLVLITGETGTGKELIARGIHNRSHRNQKILVKVNCSAIPSGLIESELFGHEKGAFTGAVSRRIGRFELADGGSIFLDEIGELPLDLQAKLLRVLEEGEFERVGSSKTFKVDVRVISATNRHLEELMKAGQFRSDLFYRLHVFPIHLPPLRERKEDIPLLVRHFAKKLSSRFGKNIEEVSPTTITKLQSYPWPGNVRELEHVVERGVILSDSSTLIIGDWFLNANTSAESEALITLEEHERRYILRVLDHTGWKVSGHQGAAQILGLKPTTLESRMTKLGISRKS